MNTIGRVSYVDEQEQKLKISKFIGYNKYGDEGDMPLGFSFGGYGFDVSDMMILPVQLNDLMDTFFDTTGADTETGGFAGINSFSYHARVNSDGLPEIFLFANVVWATDATAVNRLYVRYLPRQDEWNPSNPVYPYTTTWTNISGTEDIYTTCGVSFVNYQEGTTSLTIFGNGPGEILKWNGAYTDGVPSNVSKLNADAPNARFVAMYNDHVFAAGISGSPNAVHWSKLMEPSNWTIATDGAGYTNVIQGRGDSIAALRSTKLGLLMFKTNSLHRLAGTVAVDFSFDTMSMEYGAINGRCIAEVNNVVYFLSKAGLMYFDGANVHPFMHEELDIDIFSEFWHTIVNQEAHGLFCYNGYLYLYIQDTAGTLYKIDTQKKKIVSVQKLSITGLDGFPSWIPLNDRCLFMAKSTTELGVYALNEKRSVHPPIIGPTYPDYAPWQWVVSQNDFGDSMAVKTVNKVTIRGEDGTCRITPVVDGVNGTAVSIELPSTAGIVTAYVYARGKMIGWIIDNGPEIENGRYDPTKVFDIQIPYEIEEE
jgi:hypothetical protein